MRTKVKGNVIDAVTEPLGGAVLDDTELLIWGGITVPDGAGVNLPCLIVAGDYAYEFPIGRKFVVIGGPNAGTYTVVSPGGQWFEDLPNPFHLDNSTEIPTSPVPPSAGSFGDIQPFGINMGGNKITELNDPNSDYDCATKYYVDNQIVSLITPILNSLIVAGSIIAWTSDINPDPASWYFCDGSAKTVAGDSDLHSAIGYQFGGAGVTFNVPDLRGRFPLGLNAPVIVAADRIDRIEAQSLGGISGSEEVTLSGPEMPQHSHGGSTGLGGGHNHSGSTGNAGSHSHDVKVFYYPQLDRDGPTVRVDLLNTAFSLGQQGTQLLFASFGHSDHNLSGMSLNGGHDHTLNINNNVGGGGSHENTPPYQVVNYIIKR